MTAYGITAAAIGAVAAAMAVWPSLRHHFKATTRPEEGDQQ
ncbi:hypothetical protein ACWGI0_00200 [Streptomyces sp. NPDC054802]